MAELARFEWALGVAFDAADAPVLALDALAPLAPTDWERVGFTLQPALQFLTLEWNVAAMWLALEAGQTPPAPLQEHAHWLIWRNQWQPHFRSLQQSESAALQGLLAGASFASVCAEALAQSALITETTAQAAGWLQTWMAEELLTAITDPERSFHP